MNKRWLRSTAFVSAHLALTVLAYGVIFEPAAAFLAAQREEMQVQYDLSARYGSIIARKAEVEGLALKMQTEISTEDFLSGASEGVVSANLQARLKSISDAAGASLRSVQALPSRQLDRATFVGARLEISGSLKAVQTTLHVVENNPPFLLVTSCVIRLSPIQRGNPAEVEPEIETQFDAYGVVRGKTDNE
jgi:general secretion pathway protein M